MTSINRLLVLGMACTATLLRAQPVPDQDTADRELVGATCGACHDIGMVDAQRLTAAQWARTVDKMIGMGAQVSDADRLRIIAWLARTRGPQSP